ncbi:ATP-dependent zinc protease [Solimonas sp. K1W22B-7]|uniref:ATP-dependent zinc protease family protein n=1 Tax=Solimonas sp. K1W22B-7 TaxID=2303331 RepID=UPI000E334253|nr:RimK/LysX family protein [Solimonas sp. K1W22B-7]AXQ31016.1 ATP-dependent zinc protease [Solimonas sp. K1W22B-7]
MRAAAGLLLAALLPLGAVAQERDPWQVADEVPAQTYGWMERVRIETLTRYFEVEAKLDTGASSSSLHATGIELFEREGQNWLRFTVDGHPLEQPVVRRVRIKQKNGEPAQERWVVRLDLCIGQTFMPADFNLVDRSDFSTPALLGRDVLAQLGPVDTELKFTVEPGCARQ